MTATAVRKIGEMIDVLDQAAVNLDRPEPRAAAAAYRSAISLIWEAGGLTQGEASEIISRILGIPEV